MIQPETTWAANRRFKECRAHPHSSRMDQSAKKAVIFIEANVIYMTLAFELVCIRMCLWRKIANLHRPTPTRGHSVHACCTYKYPHPVNPMEKTKIDIINIIIHQVKLSISVPSRLSKMGYRLRRSVDSQPDSHKRRLLLADIGVINHAGHRINDNERKRGPIKISWASEKIPFHPKLLRRSDQKNNLWWRRFDMDLYWF